MPEETPQPVDNLAQLRQRAEQAGELETTNAQLQRQLALRDSGYNHADPLVAHLMQTYTGPATAEGVVAFLEGLGVSREISQQTQTTTTEGATVDPPTFDPSTTVARQALASDSQPPAAATRVRTDPYEAAFAHRRRGLDLGHDPDDLMADGFKAILGAAKLGDKRVLVKEPENNEGAYQKATTL